jgi:hypothetical protein
LVEKNGCDGWEWEPLLEAALRSELDDRREAAWNELENWWEDPERWDDAQIPALKALLERLQYLVPIVSIENGIERTTRHLTPHDPAELWAGKEYLKPAAKILHLGELEALVDGEPELPSYSWSRHREMITKHLNEYLHSTEPTSGEKSLSRRGHASSALELLSHLDIVEGFARHELTDDADLKWLAELVAEVAFAAFDAGRHTQAAWGKEFEKYAMTQLKNTKALLEQTGPRDEANRRKSEHSRRMKEHARSVRKRYCSGKQTAAADALTIHKNWSKIEGLASSERAPALKTLRNWIAAKFI